MDGGVSLRQCIHSSTIFDPRLQAYSSCHSAFALSARSVSRINGICIGGAENVFRSDTFDPGAYEHPNHVGIHVRTATYAVLGTLLYGATPIVTFDENRENFLRIGRRMALFPPGILSMIGTDVALLSRFAKEGVISML